MTGYLDRLVARAAGGPPLGLAPRPRSRYEDEGPSTLPAVEVVETATYSRTVPPVGRLVRPAAAERVEHPERLSVAPRRPTPLIEPPAAVRPVSEPTGAADRRAAPQRAEQEPVSMTPLAADAAPGPILGVPATEATADVADTAPARTGDRDVEPAPPTVGTATVPRPATFVAERAVATIGPADVAGEPGLADEPAPTGVLPLRVSTSRRSRGRAAPLEAPEPAPVVVEVTIGRLEIRSTREPARAARPSPAPAPVLTDYLRDRRGGR